jgi:hypothetical protein
MLQIKREKAKEEREKRKAAKSSWRAAEKNKKRGKQPRIGKELNNAEGGHCLRRPGALDY